MNTPRLEKIIAKIYSNNVKSQEEQNMEAQQPKQKIIEFIKK